MEKASPSPSRSESFSRGGGWLRSKARVAPSLEHLGESFNSSTASFIDMDPAELFSMRWTSDNDSGLPLLAGAVDDLLLHPCDEPSGIARDDAGISTSASSPAFFHSAQSTPASASCSGSRRSKPRTLMATRRLLLRYLRFLAPLCRKARSLAPRPGTATTTPARRSASSVYSAAAAEHWCHGNADTAVRDAILYCKKSFTALGVSVDRPGIVSSRAAKARCGRYGSGGLAGALRVWPLGRRSLPHGSLDDDDFALAC
ncbi:hypothetical protein QOZ80_2AG0114910 [Eleusine coracana subsp. coracana]|nr:hypothetical protein QOZ80_2AG0114910 [Eleusine coracana subsp. coracana]